MDQFHPEYAAGQLEVSVAAGDPVAAADRTVLVRQTIQAVSQAYGHLASFAPVVVAGQVGNGRHLHFRIARGAQPVRRWRPAPYGLTAAGEAMLAGVLQRCPPCPRSARRARASHLRLVPQRWAGP